MKNFSFIFCLILCWACNNDVTSIGQDLLNDDSYVELVKYNIENSSTIKLDSFPTSTAKTGSELYNLIVGAIKDPVTGFTNAQPYFSLVPPAETRSIRFTDSIPLPLISNTTDKSGEIRIRSKPFIYTSSHGFPSCMNKTIFCIIRQSHPIIRHR